MDFRRIPFQFSPIDPAERQRELQRRFGLPSRNPNDTMYVETENSPSLGSRLRESNSNTSSPRLQHRIPMFTKGSNQPDVESTPESQSNNVDGATKPRVRIVPIKVEGTDHDYSTRRRTFSGPAEHTDNNHSQQFDQKEHSSPTTKRFMKDLSYKTNEMRTPNAAPRVCNIPIHIEGKNKVGDSKIINNKQNVTSKDSTSSNKAAATKKSSVISKNSKVNVCAKDQSNPVQLSFNVNLLKIAKVLDDLKLYKSEVEAFSGSPKDKQYRYLDEMLTRCMLNLDNVDTMGNEKVRSARKAAIKEVQALIDLLESKLIPNSGSQTNTDSGKVDNITPESSNENINSTKMEHNTLVEESSESDASNALVSKEMEVSPAEELETAVQEHSSSEVSNDSVLKEEEMLVTEKSETVQDVEMKQISSDANEQNVEMDTTEPSESVILSDSKCDSSQMTVKNKEINDIVEQSEQNSARLPENPVSVEVQNEMECENLDCPTSTLSPEKDTNSSEIKTNDEQLTNKFENVEVQNA